MCYDNLHAGFVFKTTSRFMFACRKYTQKHHEPFLLSSKNWFQLYCDIRVDFYITGTLSVTICSACLGFTVSTLCNTITVTKATDSSHTNSQSESIPRGSCSWEGERTRIRMSGGSLQPQSHFPTWVRTQILSGTCISYIPVRYML